MVARSCSGSDLRSKEGGINCTSRAGRIQGRCSVSSQQPDSLAEQRRGVHKLAQDGGQARKLGEHGSLEGGRGGETQLVSCIEAAEEPKHSHKQASVMHAVTGDSVTQSLPCAPR